MDPDFCVSSAYVTSRILSNSRTFQSQGDLTGKQRKNMKFWPLNLHYKRSDWKTWLSERLSEALTLKLWNKKENTCRRSVQKWGEIEWCSRPMVLSKIFNDLSKASSFPFSDLEILFSLLVCYFSKIYCNNVLLVFTEVWPYNFLVPLSVFQKAGFFLK